MTTYRDAFQPCIHHQDFRFLPYCTGCLTVTIGNLCDLLDEAREMNDAHHLLFSAHQENFIERIYALEGGDEASCDPRCAGRDDCVIATTCLARRDG